MWLFYYFYFERKYDVLNSKSPFFLLNKNINFNKIERESKIENPTLSFREELRIKSKIVMSWSSRKETDGIFCSVYFVQRNFFLTFAFYLNV